MNYAKVKDGQSVQYPYGFAELEIDNAPAIYGGSHNLVTCFNDADIAKVHGYSLVVVEEMPIPTFDRSTQTCTLATVPKLINARWVLEWIVENKTQEQLATELNGRKYYVRGIRNNKLQDSDWTQVADAPVDRTAWAAYRQALRDIPSQAGFPDSVTWPQVPESMEIVRV